MKVVSIVSCLGIAGLVALGVAMASTKPSRAEYEEYATQRLSKYLKEQSCDNAKTPKFLDNFIKIKIDCASLVDQVNPQIKQVVSATTEKHDYLLFTVYHTNLEVHSLLPSVKFETVGALDNFFTYKLKKK